VRCSRRVRRLHRARGRAVEVLLDDQSGAVERIGSRAVRPSEADVTFAGLAGVVPGLLAWQNLGEAMRTIVVAGTHLYYYYYYYY